ncbi:SRPBCC family protein [Micromonospora sp. NPDC048871]|uniref:SRPBCC family protein n=1 Tax=unclassified Micromonospora TaxID=2617518 RepID=UPI002E14455B
MPDRSAPAIAFATTFLVSSSVEEVFDHLSDPHSYLGLSPLIVAVDEVRISRDPEGRTVADYVAVERFRFLRLLRWDNRIRVRMVTTRPGAQLVSEVASPGGVRLRAVVDLTAEATGTRVHEQVTATAPALLRRFVADQARQVAAYRAAELTRRMKGQAESA